MADMKQNYFIYYVGVAVCLTMVFEGMFMAWSSIPLSQLQAADSPITITIDQSSWITSLFSIGNIVAFVLATKIVDIFGRKKILYLIAVLASISWIITGIATTPQELYVARIIAGISVGINYVVIYLTEVSPAKIRGMICGMMMPCLALGEIFIVTIGSRLTVHTVAWIALSLPVVFVVLILPLPESPYFLVMRGRFKEAERSLRRLRGTTEVAADLLTLKNTVEMNARSKGGLRDLLTKRSNLKVLGIAMGLTALQHLSGLSVFMFFSHQIFTQINSSLVADINLVPAILKIIGSSICVLLVDRTGKKPLLIFCTSAAAMCTSILGMFFSLRSLGYDVQPYSWIPVVAFCAHSAVVSMGLTGLCPVIAGELFPLNVKAVGNGMYRLTESFQMFIVSKLYHVASHNLGIQYPFWAFSICSLAGVFFIIFAVPETTGRTLEEIQEDMQNTTVDDSKILPLITMSANPNNVEASSKKKLLVDVIQTKQ